MATNYTLVLATLHPGKAWVMGGANYSGLEWYDDSPKPTKAQLDAAWPQVKYDHDLSVIEQQRRARYLDETDPMFMRVQRGEEGITLDDWKAAVDAIRAELPYPEAP